MHALSKLIGVDRSTLQRWAEDDHCPTVHRPSDGSGKGWVFDVADVFRWREEHVRQLAVAATLSEADLDGKPLSFEERTKRAKAINAELDLGVKQGDLVFAQDVERKRDQEIGWFTQEIRSISSKLAKDINPKDQARIQGMIDRYHDAALDRLAKGAPDDDDDE